MLTPIAMRLAIRNWLARPLRPVLCSLAIAAAVSLIICVGAAMDSLRFSVSHAVGQILGVAELHIRPAQRDTDARVPQSLLDSVRAMKDVDFADGRLASQAMLIKGDDRLLYDVVGLDDTWDDKLRPKNMAAGRTLAGGSADDLMVDFQVADKLKLKVGDTVTYAINDNPPRPVKLVGIVHRPSIDIIAKATVYVPLSTLAKDLGLPGQYNVLDVKLKESAGVEDLDKYAKELGKQIGPSVEVTPGTTSKAKLSDMTKALRLMLIMLSTLSGICASLIIGTTLSVGVQERVRQFGQLRCIGASRGQLAAFLLGDAAVMLVIGEALGLVLGVLLSMGLISLFPSFFEAFQLSVPSLLIAFGCGCFATLVGAAIPIWQVTRVTPMTAVTSTATPASTSRVRLAGIIGVLCLVTQILLWSVPSSRDVRVFSYLFAGVPLIFGGWCLLAPSLVLACGRVGAAMLGPVFRVRPALLRSAWTRTPWRAGAMIAALMIGVCFFTTARARGRSLLTSWEGPQIPDVVIKSLLSSLSDKRIARLMQEHPEIEEVSPFDYFGVKMKTHESTVGKIVGEEQTTFIAVKPEQFLRLVPMEFQKGNPATAVQEIESGRHVFVSSEFATVRKVSPGDKVTFKAADGSEVEFTIAGVVESTGVEVVKNYFDLRATFGDKAVSSVLGSIDDGKKYFKMPEPKLALISVKRSAANVQSMAELRQKLQREAIESLSSVEVKSTLNELIGRIMDGLSIVGLGALCVASLGVANMIIASIHARRYEFGVLRAIGAGRWQLVRLVLAEVSLIGFIAGILGAGAGLSFAFMATQLDYVVIGFPTKFIDPNIMIAVLYSVLFVATAIMLTTLLGWLASLIPAIRGASMAQRAILAAGRT